MNMKAREKNKKRIGIAVIISVIMLTMISAAVSAVYINQNVAKRVVSTQGAGGTPFSSNYLLLAPKETSTFAIKTIYCSEEAEMTQFVINVCNYAQNDPSKVNEYDISYTLTLTLTNADGSVHTGSFSGLSVTDNDGTSHSFSSGVCTISNQLLLKNQRSVNTYTVFIPKAMVGAVDMSVLAEPSESSYSAVNGNKLGRTFTFAEYNAAATTWTGSFSETTANGYDAFNYIIRGQGTGRITLTWDPSQLEINKYFFDNYGLQSTVTDTENGKKSLSFDVNSTDGLNRYDIQFYKTENGSYPDMDTINKYVSVDFSEA